MTRQQIKSQVRDLLGEVAGTPGHASPFALDTLINAITDEMAQASDCFYARVQTEVNANQSEYCGPSEDSTSTAPSIYKLKAVTYTNTSGQHSVLQQVDLGYLDDRLLGWRNGTTGTPLYYVPLGGNRVKLYPTPDTSSASNSYTDLVIGSDGTSLTSAANPFSSGQVGYLVKITGGTGFNAGLYPVVSVSGAAATVDGQVGTSGSTGGTGSLSYGGLLIEGYAKPGGSWASDSAECPLPGGDGVHMGVVYGVAARRTIQFPTQENMLRLPMLRSEYEDAKGRLFAAAIRQSQATAFGDNGMYTRGWAYYYV